MHLMTLWENILYSVIFSFLGLICFAVGFWVFDKLTPFSLWKELIQEHNTALAIVVGSVSIGLCLIIAFAIH